MPRLIVDNVGPIKHVDLDLSKINVFMGPQSCGKSTLAKIISTCSWIEKRRFRDNKNSYLPIYKQLCSYHKLGSDPFSEGSYIQRDSKIAYLGDSVYYFLNYSLDETIRMVHSPLEETTLCGEEIIHFLSNKNNPKVIYIPAERNFVSRVPNLGDYNKEWDNLQGFVRAWYDAKSQYSGLHPLEVLNLHTSFYTDEQGVNYVTVDENNRIKLDSASSGLQSVVPLLAMVKWLSKGIYEQKKPYSPNEERVLNDLMKELNSTKQVTEDQKNEVDKLVKRIQGFVEGRLYTHTQFIVEEPEQNLFPETQCLLVYELLMSMNHGKQHRLVMTTHSPYILYALNNCLLAHKVSDSIPIEKFGNSGAIKASIDPSYVRVWEIKDGYLKPFCDDSPFKTIQDKDGLIRQNFFNSSMQKIILEFNKFLSYKK